MLLRGNAVVSDSTPFPVTYPPRLMEGLCLLPVQPCISCLPLPEAEVASMTQGNVAIKQAGGEGGEKPDGMCREADGNLGGEKEPSGGAVLSLGQVAQDPWERLQGLSALLGMGLMEA